MASKGKTHQSRQTKGKVMGMTSSIRHAILIARHADCRSFSCGVKRKGLFLSLDKSPRMLYNSGHQLSVLDRTLQHLGHSSFNEDAFFFTLWNANIDCAAFRCHDFYAKTLLGEINLT